MSANGWCATSAEHKAMILRNHGLLVGGTSIAEAFHMIYMLERACAAQVAALSCGREAGFAARGGLRAHRGAVPPAGE